MAAPAALAFWVVGGELVVVQLLVVNLGFAGSVWLRASGILDDEERALALSVLRRPFSR